MAIIDGVAILEQIKPYGTIKITNGTAHVPRLITSEIDDTEINYIVSSNIAILYRNGSMIDDILKALDILKEQIKLRYVANMEKEEKNVSK